MNLHGQGGLHWGGIGRARRHRPAEEHEGGEGELEGEEGVENERE